jgi:hypothetical protein
MAWLDLGDQFIAISSTGERGAGDDRHFGLVVDDKDGVRRALAAAGIAVPAAGFLRFDDPWGNAIEVVDYRDVQFSKVPEVLRALVPEGLEKSDSALAELAEKGLAGAEPEDALAARPADEVLRELVALEPLFHHPEQGTTRDDFAALMTDDFWEVGASGAIYDREYVLDVLEERAAQPPAREEWDVSGAACRELAPGVHLLTYTLDFDGRVTRRTTVWRRSGTTWKAAYHQGTVVPAA